MLLIAFFALLALCSVTTAECDCTRSYLLSVNTGLLSSPAWIITESAVGELLADVVNVVDDLLDNLLGNLLGVKNPVINVHVGDILSLKVSVSGYPLSIWTSVSVASVYHGWSATKSLLTIGADLVGQTLYYICPNRPTMHGLIKVSVNTDGLLGYGGLLGTGIGDSGGLLGTGLLSGNSGYSGIVASATLHTYSIVGASPVWNFVGSNVGNLVGSVLGSNPVISVKVGDILTLKVTTTPQYPLAICVSILNGVCTPYNGWTPYVSGAFPVLTILPELAGRTLYYACPNQPNMYGEIRVSAAVSLSTVFTPVATVLSPAVTHFVTADFPEWVFGRSLVGSLLGAVLGSNPTITVNVGDILTIKVNVSTNYPFTIYTAATATASIYPGFNNGKLFIGAELAGKSLYYVCPPYVQSDHMFGVIKVNALVNLPALLNLNVAVRLHTYVISPLYPSWSFASSLIGSAGSLVGSILDSVLGLNPVIYVRVGDVLTLRVITTAAYPFTVSTSSTAISVYAGLSLLSPAGLLTADVLTLTIGADVAGKSLYYICPNNLAMRGLIQVVAL